MATTGQVLVAIDKATTWGTAVSVNAAGRGLYLNSIPSFVANPEQLIDTSIGRFWKECIVQGKRFVDYNAEGLMRFAGPMWEMIALCIGDDSSVQIGVSGDYNHTMDPQESNDGLFLTKAIQVVPNPPGLVIRECPSLKIGGFTFKGSAAQILTCSLKGIGNTVRESNLTNTTLASVTFLAGCMQIPFNVQVRMNDEDDAALDSTNVIQASEFEFTFDRNLQPDFTTNGTLYETAEPLAAGQPNVELKLLFPKTPITNFSTGFDDLAVGTKKKIDIIITGTTTGNGNNFTLTLQFPSVQIASIDPPIEGDNVQMPQTITFTALKTSSAPAGMTGVTLPFRLVLLNSTSTAYDT